MFYILEVEIGNLFRDYLAKVHSIVVYSHNLFAGEIKKFSTEEVDRFRELFFADIVVKLKECLLLVWSSEISEALGAPGVSDCV
ncbi:hypothetical protein [Candidatus Ichthyocystis sparus]|uniref:hypothetical protein n=1 Tax=Candidatus Ichthyocystis sparus TaxID=1561004 RepID=UPI000B863775|nr:hypothetical protein [Candidatus Ichthyocystis sparus]